MNLGLGRKEKRGRRGFLLSVNAPERRFAIASYASSIGGIWMEELLHRELVQYLHSPQSQRILCGFVSHFMYSGS